RSGRAWNSSKLSDLDGCLNFGPLVDCKKLHGRILKMGLDKEQVLCDKLIDVYVALGDLDATLKVFGDMLDRNVASWNNMISVFLAKKLTSEVFGLHTRMMVEDVSPNDRTFTCVLRACTGKNVAFDYVEEILRRLTEDDVVCWTAMIAEYTQNDLFSESLKLFREMLNRAIQSDNIGLSSACAGIQTLDQGRKIHAQSFVSGLSNDLSIGNALVNLHSISGRIDEAYLAFETIDSKDIISWNGLISGFKQSGFCEEALQVFAQMTRAGVEPNLFTVGSAVSAAANIANRKQGKQMHSLIIKTGYDSETEISNVLITLYAKSGSIDDARREFSDMPEKTEVSWNALITGYSQHGCGLEALNLFEKMKQLGVMPNHVTFVGVLSACSHVGLVNEGLNCFESMTKEHGLVPKPEHCACVVDLLCWAGSLSRALEFIEKMTIEPDAMIWRTLISAWTVQKNLEIGEFAANHLLELEPKDSATYVLSNLYAVTGKWDRRDQTRKLMKDRGVKKEPSCHGSKFWTQIFRREGTKFTLSLSRSLQRPK
ncbi:PPR domain-containing protein/PPR_2 domain-containing protein/PPR_3 domain-containing protein, partial [Cephalotus follicularis]